MSKSCMTYFNEWHRITEESKEHLKSDCPLMEDEAILFINDHVARLSRENKKLKQTLKEIQSMCIGELTMGYKMDPNYIGDLIYKKSGIKAE